VIKFIENNLHNRESTAFLNKASYGQHKLESLATLRYLRLTFRDGSYSSR